FMTPNNTVVGAVRLNLDGREPCGRLNPSDRREALGWLADRLAELVNVDTGDRVVRRCDITDDIYRRSEGDAFGDLFVEWERSAPIERVWSPATGTVAVPYEHWRQGDHVREGLMLATGPGIRPGLRSGAVDSVDVGATLAAAVGVPLPDADGRPIGSMLPDGVRRPAPGGRRLAQGRARLGQAMRRRAQGRVPGWATRQDLALDRLRRDHTQRADRAEAELSELKAQVGELERHSQVAEMAAWLPHAEVSEQLLISVVLPTHNRRQLLADAIESVQAQSYRRWELLVVDDGSTDETPAFLDRIDDPRVRRLRTEGVGVCAARNVALDAATGDVIAYLDDDNRFDSQWLKAIALTFTAHPDQSVCYGARVFDDEGRVLRGESSGRPGFQFVGWDPDTIRENNFVDMNVLAHRRSAARFDEALSHLGDWDLLLQLAPDAKPVEVPAIAVYYRTDVSGRMTTTLPPEELDREHSHVRAKLAAGAGG
ncbi:MAG: glycosyltransferase, partial [Solirubrobacterales bacterium]